MNLSATQKQSLREARTRLREGSELARQRRTELVQRLTARMVEDDSWTMERLSAVSSQSRAVGVRGLVAKFGSHGYDEQPRERMRPLHKLQIFLRLVFLIIY